MSFSTIHLSVAIRRGLSPSPHRSSEKNLPVVPSRESNSGLSCSKPTCYQLSHAALWKFYVTCGDKHKKMPLTRKKIILSWKPRFTSATVTVLYIDDTYCYSNTREVKTKIHYQNQWANPTCGHVLEKDGVGSGVDRLAAGSGSSHKFLLQIIRIQAGHSAPVRTESWPSEMYNWQCCGYALVSMLTYLIQETIWQQFPQFSQKLISYPEASLCIPQGADPHPPFLYA